MRLGIGVHGRFYAFDAAAALHELGTDVRLYTNYPRSIVERFGFPPDRTNSMVRHGVLSRAAGKLYGGGVPDKVESMLKHRFGRWLAYRLVEDQCTTAFCWSGVAEEAFNAFSGRKLLNRSSLHIRVQRALLEEESERVGRDIEKPGDWIVAREEREYELADSIVVPSRGAARSFAGTGLEHKIEIIPLTADATQWQPRPGVVEERLRRISAGERLRVLQVGTVSYRKGLFDAAAIVARLHERFDFRFTGEIARECRATVTRMRKHAIFDGHLPESELAQVYAWADVLLLPSIEDGFGVVIAHAQAAALPFIATVNTGGADLLELGGRGWVVPIRDADGIVECLLALDEDRAQLGDAVLHLQQHTVHRTWHDVARDLLSVAH